MRASTFEAARRVAYKELLDGVRHRAGYVTMGMFALTVIAFMSMALAGDMPDARQSATLYWIVIFFAATLQGERLFAEEAAAGTLLFLRIYVPAQAVLFGKMAAHLVTLLILSVIIMPFVIVLMDAMFMLDAAFLIVLLLALWGMAAADTLIAITAGEDEAVLLGGIFIYDMALTVGASILFDHLWIET